MSKLIWDCIGFALLRSVSGLQNSCHPLNQSDPKLKPIASWSLTFYRASGWLHVFTLSSHWLLVIFAFVLIGRCDYFGFGFTTLNRKALSYKSSSTYCCVSLVLDPAASYHLIKHYNSCHTLAVVLRTGLVGGTFWWNSCRTRLRHTCGSGAVSFIRNQS